MKKTVLLLKETKNKFNKLKKILNQELITSYYSSKQFNRIKEKKKKI